jgi:hypothetical protein
MQYFWQSIAHRNFAYAGEIFSTRPGAKKPNMKHTIKEVENIEKQISNMMMSDQKILQNDTALL